MYVNINEFYYQLVNGSTFIKYLFMSVFTFLMSVFVHFIQVAHVNEAY